MALKFGETAGSAVKNRADSFEVKNGENRFRIFGGILARYVYWIKGENNKNIPFECLEFSREEEKFGGTNQKDWVKEYYPDAKCSWAYVVVGIDPTDNKVKIWNLKKKLFEQILSAAEDLGLRGWLFEGRDAAAHRIHRAENMPDDAVLAGAVHALQTDQYGSLALRVELCLKLAQTAV